MQCRSTAPAAIISARTATLRVKNADRRRVFTACFHPYKTAAIGGFARQVHVPPTLPQTNFRCTALLQLISANTDVPNSPGDRR